jgi:MHS family alpha-ketoglutarate permease-like MFS transporter
LFGHLADHYGRRNALMLSVLLMCFGSLMIAVTPTYASIGIRAPVLLGLARMVQGLSLGGEYGTSATYLTEVADEKHRGFYSSFQYVTLIGGQLCAILVLLLLQQVFLTADQLKAWGWRIPFFIGALLALVALVMRRSLYETDEFVAAKRGIRRQSSVKALMKYPREVLVVVGLTMGGTTAFYTYTTYMQKFLKLSVGLNDNQTTFVTAGSLVFALCLQPLYGALSDRIGRKPLLIWFGAMGTICTIPLLYLLQGTKSAFVAFLLIATAWLIVAGYTSINAVVKAELFPTHVRATGVGLPYAVTVSIFGGTAESIALWFKSIGRETWFYYYLTLVIATSLVVYVAMRDTKHHSAIGRHHA